MVATDAYSGFSMLNASNLFVFFEKNTGQAVTARLWVVSEEGGPGDFFQSTLIPRRGAPRCRNTPRVRGGGCTGVGDHLGTMRQITVTIDRTSPKFLWWIALLKVYKPTKFRGENYQGTGSVGKKLLEILKKS